MQRFDSIENSVGILSYASSATAHAGFAAVLKARYSDFLVHEGKEKKAYGLDWSRRMHRWFLGGLKEDGALARYIQICPSFNQSVNQSISTPIQQSRITPTLHNTT